jgi:hypothetical protein
MRTYRHASLAFALAADCGRTCCMFEGGKKSNKKGVCVQVGD